MTENQYNEIEEISRDYVDNFSFKEMVTEDMMPKFFEEETSNLTVGLTGLISELTGTMTEDAFNASSTLLLETFPTRARMENSIYSNAAIFQLSDVFAETARCDFLIVISEKDIIRNFTQDQGGHYNYFYIDKNTTVYVEDIPFVLDYDIIIRAIYRETQGGYVYSAKYDMSKYTNCIEKNHDPYIKVRKSSNGLIALQVNMGQYQRKVIYESIIDNATLNYPTINVPFSDRICGLDVLYKGPNDIDYRTQLKLKVRFSQPVKDPFCYYRKINDEQIELSFTTKDTYFQPEFNSEVMVVVYTTLATDANFDKYEGENISLIKNTENYQYLYSWAVSVKPLGASSGGKEHLTKEGLQALTIEGFSTANALTTEHDLQVYFNNYKYRYGAEVLFLKKRDDTAERLYSAFLYMKKDDYFYPTNTLSLDTNILKFDEKDQGFYNMDPGFLFSYGTQDIYRVLPIYYITDGNGEYYDKNGKFHTSDGLMNGEFISLEDLEKKIKSGDVWKNPDQYYVLENDIYYLKNEDGSNAQVIYTNPFDESYYKLSDTEPKRIYYHYDKKNKLLEDNPIDEEVILGYAEAKEVVKTTDDEYNDPIEMSEGSLMKKFREGGLQYDYKQIKFGKYVDFIRDEEKELQLRYDYLNYYEEYMNVKYYDVDENGVVQETYYKLVNNEGKPAYLHYKKGEEELLSHTYFTEDYIKILLERGQIVKSSDSNEMSMSEYMFNFTFEDYKKKVKGDTRLKVFDENIEKIASKYDFLFTNPFLMSVSKLNGLIGYYMTNVNQDAILDFVDQNDADAFVQFITYTLHVSRPMAEEKRYSLELSLLPSVTIESDFNMVEPETIFDPENPSQFQEDRNSDVVCDLLSYNKDILKKNNLRVIIQFLDNKEDKLQGYMELIPIENNKGKDQIKFRGDFLTDDYVITDNLFRVTHKCPHCGNEILNSVNTENGIFSHDYYCDSCGQKFSEGIINTREMDDIWIPIKDAKLNIYVLYKDPTEIEHPTNNDFVRYDSTYEGYHWTNLYSSITEPITFIQPMNLLRSNIEYKDYYQTGVDALDCYIRDVPLVKYSIIAYKDNGPSITNSLEEDDVGKYDYFLKSYTNHYHILDEARILLRNNTNIDTKFYNTYGKSTNFVIGENEELIDTVNIRIKFDVWLIVNTDPIFAENNLKTYIKEYIESINNKGTNDLYISNLIRGIENNFAYVHHLVFRGINNYDVSYQAIKNKAIDLDQLSKQQRRHFVPDLLTVNRANIDLKFFEVSE